MEGRKEIIEKGRNYKRGKGEGKGKKKRNIYTCIILCGLQYVY